jgi:hypothetical protein
MMASSIPALPTELWLSILESTNINEAEHLWTSVRPTSRQFRDYVERLFITTYLPHFAIALSLPRRDPVSGAMKWQGIISKAQIVMSFESADAEINIATFVSPLSIKDGVVSTSVEELRTSNMLPTARLLEAPAWVYANNHYMMGTRLQLPMDIEWDEERKRWVWQLEWKILLSRFYKAKLDGREKRPSQSRGQKWSKLKE